MKTKYIAVPVSERLPEERVDVIIIDEYGDKGEGFVLPDNDWMVYSDSVTGSIEYWLEPVPDHSEEMLSLLEEVNGLFKPDFYSSFDEDQRDTLKQIEELINKVKP
ncbi:hypothetical protein [Elizabethkingia meningoseptica]|uniref:hypothetical protein n=1 Tax=Elizabethkingia meningoseptica TaxID=238 RepID=UPI00162A8E84|nr:hypothetical protein [Elizabethkingia meningoseptica]MBG0514074.1 hypothetical protein [Elizabethkingia meningoseptica]